MSTLENTSNGAHGDYPAIPSALKERKNWIVWKEEERDGKLTKIPVDPQNPPQHGDATDEQTWTNLETAIQVSKSHAEIEGIGFCFDADGLLTGVDLDDCRDPESGDIEPWAKKVVRELESYTEISPSGSGLHIYVFGMIPDGGNRKDNIEMYDENRFFTVTGDHLDQTPSTVEKRQSALKAVHEEHIADDNTIESGVTPDTPASNDNHGATSLSDEKLIEKAKNAHNGDKFSQLWNGNTSGYPSHSEADQALCNLLAFWCGPDESRIADLFSQSGLYREKWERDDYRERTIKNAIHGRDEYYDPSTGGYSSDDPKGQTDETPLVEAVDGTWFDADKKVVMVRATADYTVDELADLFQDPDNLPSKVVTTVYEADGGDAYLDNPDGWKVEKVLPDKYTYRGRPYSDLSTRELKNAVLEEIPTNRIAYLPNREEWLWCNDDGIWQTNGDGYIRRWLDDFLGRFYTGHIRREVMDQLQARSEQQEKAFGGGPPGTIATKSGLLDLEQGEIKREVQPSDCVRWTLATEYDPDAKCPKWREFLGDVAEASDIPLLQEFVGYTLHHWSIPHKKALIMFGPTDAGKSVFVDVVEALFGGEESAATSSTSVQYLANERWGPARLVNTALNVRSDLDEDSIENTGKLKELIAGDSLDAEYKRKPVFQFRPTAKHIFAANRAPSRSVDDEAFWNRWLTVVFPRAIPADEQIHEYDEQLKEEIPGILNWALEGYQRLMEQGSFTGEPLPFQNREKWERYGDSIEQWLDRCTEQEPDAFTPKWSTSDTVGAYDSYVAFARNNGLEVETDNKFTSELKRRDGVSKTQQRLDGERPHGYRGITLTDDAPGEVASPDDDDTDDTHKQMRVNPHN